MEIIKGKYTPFIVDLSHVNFTGLQKAVLTIKNDLHGEEIITREYTSAAIHADFITPEEADKLNYSAKINRGRAYMDVDGIKIDGKRIPLSEEVQMVSIIKGSGDVHDGAE